MKLEIDLPNDAYDYLMKNQVLPENINLEYFIIHGIPLEEEFKKIKAELLSECPNTNARMICLSIIDKHIAELKEGDTDADI